jgi:hypothetical protein
MAQFAVISFDKVINSIVADSKETAEEITGLTCVVSSEAGIGWAYDDETGEFTEPVTEETEAPVEEPSE